MKNNPIARIRIGAAFYNACIKQRYTFSRFIKDLTAGITVGVIAIPLAMALAIASGVPPQYGLYTAGIAGFVIALTGGSRFSVSGPTAAFVVILLPVSQEFGLAGLLVATLLSGLILIMMGFLRLGRVIEYIPMTVTLGFTAGIAITIASMQIPDFLGLTLPETPEDFISRLTLSFSSLSTFHVGDFFVGLSTLLVLIYWRKLNINFPAHLPAILVGVGVMWFFTLLGYSVETIGSKFTYLLPSGEMGHGIPSMLPSLNWPWEMQSTQDTVTFTLTLETITALLPAAISMAVLGAIESLLCAVILDHMTHTKNHPNTELVGQGIGNIIAPFFGGITATAAIARSAANVKAGATSPLAAIFHAIFVLLALVFLAKALSYLPLAGMAALLLMVAWHMSEAKKIKEILRYAPKQEIFILVVCLLLTVFFDMIVAIAIGMILAAFLFIQNMATFTKLVKRPETDEHQSRLVLTIQGPLFFAAAERIFTELSEQYQSYQTIILRWESVTVLDMGGLQALTLFMEHLEEGRQLIITEVPFQPLRILAKSNVQPIPNRLTFYGSLDEALTALADQKEC